MNKVEQESKPKINRNSLRLPLPTKFKRDVRFRKNRDTPRRNDGSKKGGMLYAIFSFSWGWKAIYTPQHKKIKGYQRENKKYRRYRKVA